MSEIQLAHFTFGGDDLDRSRMHEVAIREAHISADWRETVPSADRPGLLARLGLVRRLRPDSGVGTVVETCYCPA